jgi:Outer membrane lipoprotein-sorting protein
MNFLPPSSSSFSSSSLIIFSPITRTRRTTRRIGSSILTGVVLFFSVTMEAQTTNHPVEAEIQGRQLAQRLCEAQPLENFTNTGFLEIRGREYKTSRTPIRFATRVTETNWANLFEGINTNSDMADKLRVVHRDFSPNHYAVVHVCQPGLTFSQLDIWGVGRISSESELMTPFVQSDFWICDLGLEFFHWPQQKILKHEMRRGRSCKVLESTNPNPSPSGYSRVVSWIDNETLGMVQAEAYDAKGKLLKEFYPKTFKKVNGQWELQEMEIRNDQTGSRTRLEFDLKHPD